MEFLASLEDLLLGSFLPITLYLYVWQIALICH